MKCIGSKLVSRLKSMNKVYSLFKKKRKKEKDNYIRGLKFDCHVKIKSVKYINEESTHKSSLRPFFFFLIKKSSLRPMCTLKKSLDKLYFKLNN